MLQPVRQGAFDAAEGLMLRFSSEFYVGSMKNVPPALLASNTITRPRISAFRERPAGVHFKSAATFAAGETALIGFANDA